MIARNNKLRKKKSSKTSWLYYILIYERVPKMVETSSIKPIYRSDQSTVH